MPDRPIAPQSREEDTALDRALRPVSLAEFPGQERLEGKPRHPDRCVQTAA